MKISLLALFLLGLQAQASKIPQFVPQGYYLDLHPDLDIKYLKGSVAINIATYAEPTNVIELDADPSVSVNYKSIKVIELVKSSNNGQNTTDYQITAVERVLFDSGKLRIHLNRKLLRDITYQVHIHFEKALNSVVGKNEPFYMRTYNDKTKYKTKFFIMDLTRNGCYKAFPCFNEPSYKTWITLSVVRKNDFYALSAAPVNHTTPLDEAKSLVKDNFLSTPPLSLKSLALVVSDLVIPKPSDSSFAERGNAVDNAFVYDIPRYVLDQEKFNLVIKTLEEHLLIPFSSKVFNIMACPREAQIPEIKAYNLFILTKPQNERDYISNLILAVLHQWFYHVATPVSEKSLIDPIAARFISQTSSKILKKLNILRKNEVEQDITLFMELILSSGLTELPNTTDSAVANTIFVNLMDNLYDSKLLTETAHMLLRKKEFKMYSEQDIWHSLKEAASRLNKEYERTNYDNMEEVLHSWKKPGFLPLVDVRRDYENNKITITQEPLVFGNDDFKLLKAQQNSSHYTPRMVPAVISHPNNYFSKNEFLGWVSDKNHSFHLKSADGYNFIIFNPSYIGFFVTNYDEHNWMALLENFNALPMTYKLQLLFDSMVLASIDKLNITYFLNMSLAVTTDEHALPLWFNYEKIVSHFMNKLHGQVGRKFKEYVFRQQLTLLNNIQPSILNSYPKNDRELIERSKKEIKYALNCLRNRAACFTLWEYEILMYEVRTGKSLSGEHNCAIMRNVSLSDWEIIANALFHVLQNNVTYNKEQVLTILTCTENPVAFETLMNLMYLNFNENEFLINEYDQQLVLYITGSLQDTNHNLLLQFADKNFYILKERLSDRIWSQFIRVLVTTTKTADESKELFDFYNKYSGQFGVADEIIKNGLMIVSKKVRRETELYSTMDNWLNFALNKFDAFI